MKFYIRGGIGDLLQSLWFVCNYPDKEYVVHTHFKKTKEIFDYLGIKNASFYKFDDLESHNEQVDLILKDHGENSIKNIQECPRAFYSSFAFGEEADEASLKLINSFKENKDIIGIHPFRSGFALSVYDSFDLPAKIIPLSIVQEIISSDKNYLIFGSKEEFSRYGLLESDNVKFVSFDNMLYSLNTVKHCKKMIGLDSCFKSMSSMQKIFTICLIGDFPDPTRDKFFINQYVSDNNMVTMRVKDIESQREEIISFIKNSLS